MSRNARIALAIVAVVVFMGAATVTLAATAIYRAGTLSVAVHETGPDGADINVVVPAAALDALTPLVPLAAAMAIPEREQDEMRPWLPVVTALCEEIQEVPDGVFVEVESGDEHVLVAKRGNQFVVEVNGDDESVRVSIPLRTVARVARGLEAGL